MATKVIKAVGVNEIRENPVALRPVNKDAEAYKGLIESIKQKGFIGTISVRPAIDAATGASYYELIDGLHRWNAAKDAGLADITVEVYEGMSKMEVMEMQINMNIHKVETRPVEYTHQLQKMFSMNPTMTKNELSTKLGKSPAWVDQRLSLTKLDEKIQPLVDDGKITLSNAFSLAKLPVEDQANFIEDAMTKTPAEFMPKVAARIKEIRDARSKGKNPDAPSFIPVALFQKKSDIEDEIKTLKNVASMIEGKTAAEAAVIALQWTLSLDPNSVAMQKAKHDEREAARKEAAEKRKADREQRKEEEAKAAIADAGIVS